PPRGRARNRPRGRGPHSSDGHLRPGADVPGRVGRFLGPAHPRWGCDGDFAAAPCTSGGQLVDLTDKTAPTTIAFWTGATNVGPACHGKNTLPAWDYQGNCYLQAREVWGAKFGESVPGSPFDVYVYASDFWEGFLVLRTVSR